MCIAHSVHLVDSPPDTRLLALHCVSQNQNAFQDFMLNAAPVTRQQRQVGCVVLRTKHCLDTALLLWFCSVVGIFSHLLPFRIRATVINTSFRKVLLIVYVVIMLLFFSRWASDSCLFFYQVPRMSIVLSSCVFITVDCTKTALSGPIILFILLYSNWSSQGDQCHLRRKPLIRRDKEDNILSLKFKFKP